MAKAHRAPIARGSTYYVSTHAVQQFRERTGSTFAHRADDDLVLFIDSTISAVIRSGDGTDTIIDNDRSLLLVDLKKGIETADVFALIGPNLDGYQARHKEAVISIFSREHVQRARSNGRWEVPFNGLGDKLRATGVQATKPRPVEPLPSMVATPQLSPIEEIGLSYARRLRELGEKKARLRALEQEVKTLAGEVHEIDQIVKALHEELFNASQEPA